jgi:nucleoside-diphosphate-sugar epimerase
MKYIITGYTGFIGKSLLGKLEGNEFFLIGREWQTDNNLSIKIRDFNPDYIIHCAAEIKNSSRTFSSNILMTNWLLENTLDLNYKAFINIGSSSEYGKNDIPISEKESLKPRTMYEATKGASTLLCQGYANEYNKPIATIRPFSVYGIHEPKQRLIPTLFRNFKNNIPSKISIGFHDFIYIEDFIDGLLKILYSDPQLLKGDIINLGTGIQYSNLEVFNIIKKIFKSDLEYEPIDNIFNKYDTLNWVADISYAKGKYNFNPKYNLEKGLKHIYDNSYK